MIRRDHAPASSCLSGSGLPTPANGSRTAASTNSSTRRAIRRSVSTQNRRSSRNLGLNSASSGPRCGFFGGSLRFAKVELPAEVVDRLHGKVLASGLCDGLQEPLRVLGRTKEMGGLHPAAQFVGGNQRDVAGTAMTNQALSSRLFRVIFYRMKHPSP